MPFPLCRQRLKKDRRQNGAKIFPAANIPPLHKFRRIGRVPDEKLYLFRRKNPFGRAGKGGRRNRNDGTEPRVPPRCRPRENASFSGETIFFSAKNMVD
nr:hypothetical protein [Bacillaceae bacterium]